MEVPVEADAIRLLVKAPDQKIDDKIIECQRNWTILRLKNHLEEVYPGRPKPSEQKIIFSGQLLNDSTVLKDVLHQHHVQTENTFIIHLVCSSARYTTTTTTTTPVPASTTRPTTTAESTSAHTGVNPSATSTNPFLINQQYPSNQFNNQQIAWMQQAYAHYLTQYMQVMAAQTLQWQNTIPYTQQANGSSNIVTPNSSGPNNNEDRSAHGLGQGAAVADGAAAAAAGPGAPVVPPNNNNVGEEREAGIHRDWLDMFDIFARLLLFCSVVYFYSSPSRFFIVTFLGFAIYLIQGGFFRIHPMFLRENNNGAMENNNFQQGAAQQAGQEQQRTDTIQQGSNDTQMQNEQRTNVNRDNERPGALTFAWTFFTSFFTSLIPEQPPVI